MKNCAPVRCVTRLSCASVATPLTAAKDYDKFGPDKMSAEAQFADPKEFFAQMFGGGLFEEFFGELNAQMSTDADTDAKLKEQHQAWIDGGYKGHDPIKQHYRELFDAEVIKLTELMVARIEPVMSHRVTLDEFRVWARQKARSLLDENLGPDLLHSVGLVYATEAQRLRGGLGGLAAGLRGTGHEISSKWSMVKGLVDVARQSRVAEELQEHQERDELSLTADEMQEIQANMMQSGFTFMWKYGRIEAESKMRRVVQATVRDGEEQLLAELAAKAPTPPPVAKKEKKSMFGGIIGSISKQFASPTAAEEAVAEVRSRKLDAIEAAKPGVEQRQKDEKLQKEAAAAKIRAMRAEGERLLVQPLKCGRLMVWRVCVCVYVALKVRMEREALLAEERKQGKVIAG